jgi:hypothetical protein
MAKNSRQTRTIYRDAKSGRFAKKSSWKAAKSRGSSRFKRERVNTPKIEKVAPKIIGGGGGGDGEVGGGTGVAFPPPEFNEDDYFDEDYEAEEEDEY